MSDEEKAVPDDNTANEGAGAANEGAKIPDAEPVKHEADPVAPGTAPVDDGKTIALLSYITLIGWIVAIVLHNDPAKKTPLGAFHLRQALGVYLTALVVWIPNIFLMFIPFIGFLFALTVFAAVLGIWVIGLIAAINGEQKPIPVVGEFYQKLLAGIQ